MAKKLTSVLKYGVGLAVAVALLWVVFRDWEMEEMVERFTSVNYSWVLFSVFLSLISHVLRAYRWNLLLEPLGYKLSTFRTFLAVMVGYVTNLVAPRAGEIARCGVLKKTDNVNMSSSIGTVVAERIFDFLVLLTVIFAGLIIESDRLSGFFSDFINAKSDSIAVTNTMVMVLGFLAFLVVATLSLLWFNRARIKRLPIYFKIRSFLREMTQGFTSVLRLDNRSGFWISTALIWILYYLMAYVLFFSTDSTSHLGFGAGLSILIMGGLGMSAPVQGGFGTYHIFVGSVLALYGIPEKDGYFFATLIHTSQTLSVILFGGLSFVLSIFISKRNKKN